MRFQHLMNLIGSLISQIGSLNQHSMQIEAPSDVIIPTIVNTLE